MWYKALALSLLLAVTAQAETGVAVKNHVRALIGQLDSTNSTVTDAQVKLWIATSMKAVSALGLIQQTETTYVGGTTFYTPPAGFIGFSAPGILVRGGEFIKFVPVVSPDSLYRMGNRPTAQSMGADNHLLVWMSEKITVLPAIKSTDSVRVTYYLRPSRTVDTTEMSVSDEWEYVVALSAAAIAYASMENWGGYDRMIAERDKLLTGLRGIETLRPSPQKVP